jgi:hypothetical protein
VGGCVRAIRAAERKVSSKLHAGLGCYTPAGSLVKGAPTPLPLSNTSAGSPHPRAYCEDRNKPIQSASRVRAGTRSTDLRVWKPFPVTASDKGAYRSHKPNVGHAILEVAVENKHSIHRTEIGYQPRIKARLTGCRSALEALRAAGLNRPRSAGAALGRSSYGVTHFCRSRRSALVERTLTSVASGPAICRMITLHLTQLAHTVEAGQILYRLEPRQFQIALDNAKANLATTAMSIDAMKQDHQRMLSDPTLTPRLPLPVLTGVST